MIKHFLASQRQRTQGQTRKKLATSVAGTFNREMSIAQNLICWEKAWIADDKILERDG